MKLRLSICNKRQRNGFSWRNVKQKVNSGRFSCFFLKRHDRSRRIFRDNKKRGILLSRIGNTRGSRVHWMICLSLKPKPSLSLVSISLYLSYLSCLVRKKFIGQIEFILSRTKSCICHFFCIEHLYGRFP